MNLPCVGAESVSFSSKKILAIACFVLVFITFVLYFFAPSKMSHIDVDSAEYLRNANEMVSRGIFGVRTDVIGPPNHTFGYSFFLTGLFLVFGKNYLWIFFAHLLLAVCSVFLTFSTTESLFGRSEAKIAAILCSVNLCILIYIQYILSDLLLAFLLLVALERISKFIGRDGGSFCLYIASIALSLSILVRPSALFYAPFLVIFLCAFFVSNKLSLIPLFFASILFVIPLLLYMAYNKFLYGAFFISTLGDTVVYRYFFSRLYYHLVDVDCEFSRRIVGDVKDVNAFFTETPLSDIRQNFIVNFFFKPWYYIKFWLINTSKTLVGLLTTQLKVFFGQSGASRGEMSFFAGKGNFLFRIFRYIEVGCGSFWLKMVVLVEVFWSVFRIIPMFVSFVGLIRSKKFYIATLIVSWCGYFLLTTGFDGGARYRTSLEPLFIALSARGIFVLWTVFKRRKKLYFGGGVCVE